MPLSAFVWPVVPQICCSVTGISADQGSLADFDEQRMVMVDPSRCDVALAMRSASTARLGACALFDFFPIFRDAAAQFHIQAISKDDAPCHYELSR